MRILTSKEVIPPDEIEQFVPQAIMSVSLGLWPWDHTGSLANACINSGELVVAKAVWGTRGKSWRYAVECNGHQLTVKGKTWMYRPRQSELRHVRFPTMEDAIKCYFKWKSDTIHRMERALKKDPSVGFDWFCNPIRKKSANGA